MNAGTATESLGMRKIIIGLVVLLTVCVASLLTAGVTSLVALADRIHPLAGTVVFWTIALTAAGAAFYFAVGYARLPSALIPPEETSGPKHEKYLEELRARLGANPKTRGVPLATETEIENAITILSVDADSVVRKTASTVFLSTALMQNGRLDALILLFTQIQMVTRVALEIGR